MPEALSDRSTRLQMDRMPEEQEGFIVVGEDQLCPRDEQIAM